MCGIAGLFGLTDPDRVRAMVAAMRHRGPDDAGVWCDPAARVALGNARLAVQDLSPAGHMPMTDGRHWITYNGEVYNFIALRAELAKYGHVFRSTSDTEVILAAYRQWGTGCVRRLRGMFAFAIYDPAEGGRLFLARDHFGVKPLYWIQAEGAFVFASEVRALLASGLIAKRLDRQAVWDYLSAGAVLPPRTIIAHVRALLPGHAMTVGDGAPRIWRWWDLAEAAAQVTVPETFEAAAREVRRLLEESIRLQRVADVPVGAFLSGGIDSSTIVGLMSAQVSAPVRTVAVAFEVRSGGANELPYARMAAARFGAVHEEISVTEQDVAGGFDALVAALDQPSIDGANTYFASQAARRGVTAALSGLGGDELFAGYPHFGHFMRASRWLPQGRRALRWAVEAGGNLLPGRWRVPLAYMASAPAARHAMARQLFAAREKRALLNPAWLDGAQPAPTERWYAALVRPHLDPIAQVSYAEAAGYMAHTLLRDTDAMSMAHALEVRVPFLDHVLAEFVFALPAAWKWQAGAGKAVLRRAVRDLLPGAILDREKAGFQFPVAAWMQGVLRQPAREAFHDRTAARLFQRRAVEGLLASRRKAVQAWGVLVLLAWIKQCGVTL